MLSTWGCATFPKPTLDLQFAGATSLDSRITFTRALDTATYFDSTGTLQTANANVARFDYDPSTLAARGLLIEEARTNSYTYSEELDNPAWTVNGVTVSANAGVSPNGATTADNVIPTTVASVFKEVQQNFSATLGTTYTFSVFAKSNGYRYVQLVGNQASFGTFAVNYDLDTGTETAYTAGTSTVLQRSITPIKNGWYRLSVSVTALATSATSRLSCDIIPASNSARGVSWTGDGTSGVLMWGMQVETGAFSTSYIPTTTTALTRNADVASMTGTNFSSWYNAVEGTIVTQAIGVNNVSGASRRFVEIGDTTALERFVVGYSATTNTRFLVTDNNTTQADITVSTGVPAGSLVKMAAAYKVNDFQQASNNTLGTADASGTLPTVTTMFIGADTNAATVAATLNGHIQRISYYPSRLPNTTLQALTA